MVQFVCAGYPWTLDPYNLRNRYETPLEHDSTRRGLDAFAATIVYEIGPTKNGP